MLTSESPVGLMRNMGNHQNLIGCPRTRSKALTEETSDLMEQTKAPHCLQASKPPSGIDETVLEVGP